MKTESDLASEDEFPVGLGDDPGPTAAPSDLESFPCPDCGETFDSAFKLGGHRFRAHGFRSGGTAKKTTAKKKTKAAKGETPARRGRPPKAETQGAILAEVESSLAEAMTKGGAMVYPALPIPAGYAIATGDEFAAIVTRIASRNPKLLARLRTSSDVMDYFALGTWGVGMVVAVGVNFGRMPADGPLASQWGIDVIAGEYLAEQQARQDAAAATEETTPDAGTTGVETMGNGHRPAETVVPSEGGVS